MLLALTNQIHALVLHEPGDRNKEPLPRQVRPAALNVYGRGQTTRAERRYSLPMRRATLKELAK